MLTEENILIPRKWTVKFLRVNKNDMQLTLNLIRKNLYRQIDETIKAKCQQQINLEIGYRSVLCSIFISLKLFQIKSFFKKS